MTKLESFKGKFFFKLLLLGELAVGKTSIILRYVENRFVANLHPTIGANFLVKKLQKGKFSAILQIWDIGGHIRQAQDVGKTFYRGVDGVLFVCDLTRAETVEPLREWQSKVQQLSPEFAKILIGNKADLEEEREVKTDDLADSATKLTADLNFETSAKTGEGIPEVFEFLALSIAERKGMLRKA
ncbi:MAG: Rab family GTPase [Candidatus Hodarchaeota archaeon]